MRTAMQERPSAQVQPCLYAAPTATCKAGATLPAVVRRQQGKGAGARKLARWYVTDHAVAQYIARRRRGISKRRALRELVDMSETAHFVKVRANGWELWRGPSPMRLRFCVDGDRLVTVLPAFDGCGDEQ